MSAARTPTPQRAAALQVIRSADQRRLVWKNGGGFTTEIAAYPPGASLDAFDWRVSTAQVATDGPFSLFSGIDRTLVLLEGSGLRLTVDDDPSVQLTCETPPFTFAADKPTIASLFDGPVVDLNVMSRRSKWGHAVERIDVAMPRSITLQSTVWLLYCQVGRVRVSADGDATTVKQFDVATGASPLVIIEPDEPSTLYLIKFHRR